MSKRIFQKSKIRAREEILASNEGSFKAPSLKSIISKLTSNSHIFNRFEILSVILILIIRHLPHPELKVALFVEFAIQTLASIPEVIYMYCERTDVSSKSYNISLKYSWKLILILDGSSTDTALITPCRCKGTLQLVHRNCLERWVRTADTKSCEVRV